MAEARPVARFWEYMSPGARVFVSSLVCVGLMSSIVLPSISFGGVNVYLVTLFSPLILLLALMCWVKFPILHVSSLFPLGLGLMVCISSILSWSYGLSSVNHRDIVEAIKYLQFAPYLFVLPFFYFGTTRVFHNSVALSALLVGIVGFCQVLGVADFISYAYLGADSSHIDSVISGKRITLTGSNPNVGGVIASFFAIYFFSLYAERRKFWFFSLFLLFTFFCAMTQSRTALIALIFAVAFYYLVFSNGLVFIKWIAVVVAFSVVVFLVFYLDLSYIYIGIQYALEGRNESLNVRFENILLALERFGESPIFGVGPAKSEFDTTIDSEYALIIQRYGIQGILAFFFYIFYLFRLSFRNLESHWGVSLFIFSTMSILVMATNNIFSGYQLMSLVVFLNIGCIINGRMKKSLNWGVKF